MFFNSNNAENGKFGTGFIVEPKIKLQVLKFEAVSDKMCWIRFKGKGRNMALVNVHSFTAFWGRFFRSCLHTT